MKKLNVLAISDTHNFHLNLNRNWEDYDIIIHTGDFSNSKDKYFNVNEVLNFLTWYNDLPIQYKIVIPGNHDTSLEVSKLVNLDQFPNIIILNHEEVIIEDIKFFGSPFTPTFGEGWAFNKARNKIQNYWKQIPTDTQILLTHGPPKGILDTTIRQGKFLECVGDGSLLSYVMKIKPLVHIFGHIHDNKIISNFGVRKISNCNTYFINASCMKDGKEGIINNHGVEFQILIQDMVDPPSGWKYGFPKALPPETKDVNQFFIDNGYPKNEVNQEDFYYRFYKNITILCQ
jgi:Icc-related predicted phosphoesterase